MGAELSPEQIAEIRGSLDRDSDEFVQDRVVRDLCDTADALRAERDAVARSALRQRLALSAELETLRGIARRSRDLWTPHEQANGSTPRWVRENPDTFRVESEELTAAEVQAIYGTESDAT